MKNRKFRKDVVIKMLGKVRMTDEERETMIARVNQHPEDPIAEDDLKQIGLSMAKKGRLSSEDIGFITREMLVSVWMVVAGVALLVIGFRSDSASFQMVSSLFGTGGLYVAGCRLWDLRKFVQGLKSGESA